jgi:glutathione peroxidase
MNIYDFNVRGINGQPTPLASYRGKVVLIVNVASKCGFTPQYKGLEHLYQTYKDKGFEVLGFPCNQFGSQEPGTESEIQQFCELNFGVHFPLFAKVDVNGKNADPLYRYLTSTQRGALWSKQIKWNFTKFLVDRKGQPVARFAPLTKPEALTEKIQKLL